MTVDIFKAVPQRGTFAKFNNVGDKYQGTFIERRYDELDGFKKIQDVIVLKAHDGSIINVGIRHEKKSLMEQCAELKLGQVVGFIFSNEGKPRSAGEKPTKYINVVQDPNIVDEEWLATQKGLPTAGELPQAELSFDEVAEKPVSEIFPDATPTVVREPINTTVAPVSELSNTDKIKKIADLAKTKLGATQSSDVKDKVVEATAMAFVPANLDAIIGMLELM